MKPKELAKYYENLWRNEVDLTDEARRWARYFYRKWQDERSAYYKLFELAREWMHKCDAAEAEAAQLHQERDEARRWARYCRKLWLAAIDEAIAEENRLRAKRATWQHRADAAEAEVALLRQERDALKARIGHAATLLAAHGYDFPEYTKEIRQKLSSRAGEG
jgi:hypothetical protein